MNKTFGCNVSHMRRSTRRLEKMATKFIKTFLRSSQTFPGSNFMSYQLQERLIHTSSVVYTVKSGRIKPTVKKNKPVSYEDSFPPPHIAHRKSWTSWNTSTMEGGLKTAQTVIDDAFIRKFIEGTFPSYLLSKVIIKRQHNIIRIAALLNCHAAQRRLCFLIGYTEEILSHWLHCIVKLEFQFVNNPKKLVFKYV